MLPAGSKVAEIGVYKAKFSSEMLNLPNLSRLFMIDPWKPMPGYNDPLTGTDHLENYSIAMRAVSGHEAGGRFTVLAMPSVEAADLIADGELTAAYIDSNHSFDSAIQDLLAWEPKIKHGGFLMGHDMCDGHPMAIKHGWGVEKAISKFCKERGWEITHKTSEEFPSFALQRK